VRRDLSDNEPLSLLACRFHSIVARRIQLDYRKLDDVTLIRLIARAEADALSELYDRYNRLVFSLARNAVGDEPTAEEITLDVFARVWEKARTYQVEQAKVSTWLTSITRYRAIDELRRRSVRPEQHAIEWSDLPAADEPSTDGPEIVTELSLQRERVRAAVARLPADQRQVLSLAFFQGYTHQEISKVLNQPLGTVKTRIRTAMQKLRHMLEEE
jgi:RNA polymerase sigma-70 factor, ECF subfamily